MSTPSLPPGARPSLAILLGDDAYETIERGIRRLQDLIDNSLVQVKLNVLGDEGSLHRERVALGAVVDEVLEDVQNDAGEKEITLWREVGDDLCVDGDHRVLYSAMSNLVRNAIKFTRPHGRITVRAISVDADTIVEVKDECGGLTPETMGKLFDPFVQAGVDRSGFGLGLAITRHAAERHGGGVSVRNVPGKGCVFALRIPRASCDVERTSRSSTR